MKKFKESKSYGEFCKKWNIGVYFQLRYAEFLLIFQRQNELIGMLEPIFELNFENLKNFNSNLGLHLKSSEVFIESVTNLWDDSVFISPLLPKFWKLTLQLNYRYYAWAFSACDKKKVSNSSDSNAAVTKLNHDANIQVKVSDIIDCFVEPRPRG